MVVGIVVEDAALTYGAETKLLIDLVGSTWRSSHLRFIAGTDMVSVFDMVPVFKVA